MKVLHLITRLDPGGSAENTLLTCQALAERGWEVVLAAGPGKTRDLSWIETSGVPTVIVPSLRRDPHPVADLRALWQLLRLIRRERPDILHTHSAKGGVLGRWAGWLARTPHIVHTPHGHVLYGYAKGFKNWLYLFAEKITAPITACLVALSEGERRESVEHGIGRREQWVVIPSGVELSALNAGVEPKSAVPDFPVSPGPDRPVRIGTVARLEHVKGLDILVGAAKELRNLMADHRAEPFDTQDNPRHEEPPLPSHAPVSTWKVLIWGDGELHDELVRLAEDLGVADLVEFVGTAEPVDHFLRGLDVYVQPSRNEGMGRAMVLAQALSLPVVATCVCGIPDVVRDGESGLLVPSEDPAALAGALRRLVLDPEARARLAEGARAWIVEKDETGYPRFSLEAMVKRLTDLYGKLVGAEDTGAGE
jgi:glycosyltransferase involved in cell wall biosynthesis